MKTHVIYITLVPVNAIIAPIQYNSTILEL